MARPETHDDIPSHWKTPEILHPRTNLSDYPESNAAKEKLKETILREIPGAKMFYGLIVRDRTEEYLDNALKLEQEWWDAGKIYYEELDELHPEESHELRTYNEMVANIYAKYEGLPEIDTTKN